MVGVRESEIAMLHVHGKNNTYLIKGFRRGRNVL
jgi:hypothetical protein